MKLNKLLLMITLVALSAYLISTWSGFDNRLATYAISHEEELRVSAEQGDAEAQYRLASIYDSGIGVKRNDGEALKWYRQAAEQGYAGAQYNLGMMYYFGKGVPKDKTTGYQWVILAADQGEKTAKEAITELAKQIPNEQIAKAQAAAQAWNQAHNK